MRRKVILMYQLDNSSVLFYALYTRAHLNLSQPDLAWPDADLDATSLHLQGHANKRMLVNSSQDLDQ